MPARRAPPRLARAQRAPPAEHAPRVEAAPPSPIRRPRRSASPPARAARLADATPPRADAKQPSPGKALYDSLEQEMASLLGRPTSKT